MIRCLCAAAVLVFAIFSASAAPRPRVIIDSGPLEGAPLAPDAKAVAFLGIPFAAPPVGNLRWKPPQPPRSWVQIRLASAFRPACMQAPSPWWPEMAHRDRLETSEDCLYLNVWTANLHGAAKQPVMVWIHGGGNVEGSGAIPPLAPALVRQGVVVISIEYRLGVFGFYSHPELTAESPRHSSGNYGLLDQIAALRWIRRNASAFGGDPSRVTIFGESSGGEDVCHLMASPLAASLFARAILESGVCMDSIYPVRQDAEAVGARLAHSLGIPAGPNQLAALRAVPAGRLLEAARALRHADFGAEVDGWVLPAQPALLFDRNRNARVSVLAGSNAEESTVFGKPAPLAKVNSWPKTIAQYRARLREDFREFAGEVWKLYPASGDAGVADAFIRLQTDSQFGFGSDRIVRVLTHQGLPAYLYYFTYRGRGPFASLGSFHSEELMFLGDTFWKSWIPDREDHALAAVVGGYWTQFAKTGDPNRPPLARWPLYGEGRCLEIGREQRAIAAPHRDGYALFERILQTRLKRFE